MEPLRSRVWRTRQSWAFPLRFRSMGFVWDRVSEKWDWCTSLLRTRTLIWVLWSWNVCRLILDSDFCFEKNIGFVFSKLIACHSLDRTRKKWKYSFFAVSGKVKTNIWINIDLRKQLDSWEFFDIFWFEKTNIQIYPIFQMIFNRQKLIVLCVCLPVVRFLMLVPRAWSHAAKIEALIIIMKSSKRGRNFRFQRSQLNLNSSLLKKEMTKYWNKMGNEDTQRKPYVGQVLSDWTYCRIEKRSALRRMFLTQVLENFVCLKSLTSKIYKKASSCVRYTCTWLVINIKDLSFSKPK